MHIRVPDNGSYTLHNVGLRRGQVLVDRDGDFACGDPIYNWAWDACFETLQACVEDAYLDCPWRERGTYLGDALVEAGAARAYSADEAVTSRCIDLWAQGQMPDGQMQACVPSWHRKPHEDFTLIWVLLIHDQWAMTGDISKAKQHWQVLENIFASPSWKDAGDGLWDATDLSAFFDWGMPNSAKKGDNHGCLNAFRYRALICAHEMAVALGRDDAQSYADQAAAVRTALNGVLWNGELKRYALAKNNGELDHHADLHTNILMLHFDIVDDDKRADLIAYVAERMAGNLQQGVEESRQWSCRNVFPLLRTAGVVG